MSRAANKRERWLTYRRHANMATINLNDPTTFSDDAVKAFAARIAPFIGAPTLTPESIQQMLQDAANNADPVTALYHQRIKQIEAESKTAINKLKLDAELHESFKRWDEQTPQLISALTEHAEQILKDPSSADPAAVLQAMQFMRSMRASAAGGSPNPFVSPEGATAVSDAYRARQEAQSQLKMSPKGKSAVVGGVLGGIGGVALAYAITAGTPVGAVVLAMLVTGILAGSVVGWIWDDSVTVTTKTSTTVA